MGLSGDTDPTKDLPPVDTSGDDVIEVSNLGLTGDVGIPPGFAIERIDAEALLSNDAPCRVGESFAGKRKACDPKQPDVKRARVSDEAEGSAVGERRSRPKKLVASRSLGLMNRRQVRQSTQIVHSDSSADEYEENPASGEKRRRVGFFYRTAPRPVLPDFLTPDDEWKLEGCPLDKRIKRIERVAGMVCPQTMLFSEDDVLICFL